jgi:hypothetical protein
MESICGTDWMKSWWFAVRVACKCLKGTVLGNLVDEVDGKVQKSLESRRIFKYWPLAHADSL